MFQLFEAQPPSQSFPAQELQFELHSPSKETFPSTHRGHVLRSPHDFVFNREAVKKTSRFYGNFPHTCALFYVQTESEASSIGDLWPCPVHCSVITIYQIFHNRVNQDTGQINDETWSDPPAFPKTWQLIGKDTKTTTTTLSWVIFNSYHCCR